MTSRRERLRRLAGAWRFAEAPVARPPEVSVDVLPVAVGERVRAAAEAALAGVPGAQVAVRRGGEVVWAASHGTAGPEDRFVLASVTKPVVATLLLRLAERGTLDLDAPVATWLSDVPQAHELTARHLLGHRSGLKEYGKDPGIRPRLNGGAPDHGWRREELLDAIARLGPERKPGGRFAYRNSNYVVAAEIAERASGRDVETLLRETISAPLHLTGFSFVPDIPGIRLATPHVSLARRPVDLLATTGGRIPTDVRGPVWGDGGVASSALELARFTEALFGGELLRPASLKAMVPRVRRQRPGYGLGVMAREERGAVVAGHDGAYFGWTASASTDDATGTTVAVTANLMGLGLPAARAARAIRAALSA